jgi:tetratricopeptide (TPR) repeat protein
MKKTTQIILIGIISIILFTACSKYDVEKPNLTQEQKEDLENKINENLEKFKDETLVEGNKLQFLQEIAIKYERLGQYDNAIKYYEQILEKEPQNFLVLNNLAFIYEQVEELELAEFYISKLYLNNKDDRGVIGDTIRILVKNKKFEDAQLVLNEYARDFQDTTTLAFISSQFEYIQRMRKANEQ